MWTVEKSFKKKINKHELFGENIVDFQYILLDVNRYDKEELMEIGNAAAAIFLLDQNTDPFGATSGQGQAPSSEAPRRSS